MRSPSWPSGIVLLISSKATGFNSIVNFQHLLLLAVLASASSYGVASDADATINYTSRLIFMSRRRGFGCDDSKQVSVILRFNLTLK